MEINLNVEEKKLLLEKVNLSLRLRNFVLLLGENSKLEISESDSAEFWEFCTEALSVIGFTGENDKPTEDGLILERLIDKFYA